MVVDFPDRAYDVPRIDAAPAGPGHTIQYGYGPVIVTTFVLTN
jgi:hypothetical protein